MNEWYAVIVKGLPSTIVAFAVIYFTLRLLIKPLGLSFLFHKGLFFLALFIYVAISALIYYGSFQFTNYLSGSENITLDTIRIFNRTVSWSVFNAVWNAVSGLIITIQDVIIFVFVNHCTKQKQMESELS